MNLQCKYQHIITLDNTYRSTTGSINTQQSTLGDCDKPGTQWRHTSDGQQHIWAVDRTWNLGCTRHVLETTEHNNAIIWQLDDVTLDYFCTVPLQHICNRVALITYNLLFTFLQQSRQGLFSQERTDLVEVEWVWSLGMECVNSFHRPVPRWRCRGQTGSGWSWSPPLGALPDNRHKHAMSDNSSDIVSGHRQANAADCHIQCSHKQAINSPAPLDTAILTSAWVLFCRSLPAKSTRFNLPTRIWFSPSAPIYHSNSSI